MKVLVINCGSSSVKFEVIDTSLEAIKTNSDKKMGRGLVDRIGISGSFIRFKAPNKDSIKKTIAIKNHSEALEEVLRILVDPEVGVLKSLDEIDAVGHRFLHGAEHFFKSVIIDDHVVELICRDCMSLGPLHVPANYKGYEILKEALPEHVPHIAVFDTAFHQTIPDYAFLYGLPYEYYEKKRIRRYGFHGSSHQYCLQALSGVFAKKPVSEINAITVHLGNGCSLAAIKNGKCVDTSMGLTPLEGVIMGTRCGDIDTAAVLKIMEEDNLDLKKTSDLLNKKSGLLGISGISNDMRELDAAVLRGNHRAELAIKVFSYRIRKYIGAYLAVLGKTDYIAFAGGIGENNPPMRASILAGLEPLGIIIDPKKNDDCRQTSVISADNSPITVCIINTDEEIIIARDTVYCVETENSTAEVLSRS